MAEPRTGVSYVMPVLNEAGYVESAIRSVLDQDYSGPVEVVLALGPSHDGTREIVEKMAAAPITAVPWQQDRRSPPTWG